MRVVKRNGDVVRFNQKKIESVLRKAFASVGKNYIIYRKERSQLRDLIKEKE